jgi:hypothetical protein
VDASRVLHLSAVGSVVMMPALPTCPCGAGREKEACEEGTQKAIGHEQRLQELREQPTAS